MLKSLRSRLIVLNALLMAIFGLVLVSLAYFQMKSQIMDGLNNEFNATLYGQQTLVKNWIGEKISLVSAQVANVNRPDAIPYLDQTARVGTLAGGYMPDLKMAARQFLIITGSRLQITKPLIGHGIPIPKPTTA